MVAVMQQAGGPPIEGKSESVTRGIYRTATMGPRPAGNLICRTWSSDDFVYGVDDPIIEEDGHGGL